MNEQAAQAAVVTAIWQQVVEPQLKARDQAVDEATAQATARALGEYIARRGCLCSCANCRVGHGP